MHYNFFILVFLVAFEKGGCIEGENEVKEGTFRFMAFVYYPDTTVLEAGKRFIRNAVLINPYWLVTSTIEVSNNSTFPRKTLLARVGATTIDSNMTYNEDLGEQEREIIQVIKPKYNDSKWWYYDISLLKTLLPFNDTNAVAPTTVPERKDYAEKICYILIYGKKHANDSGLRTLMQLPVRIMPPKQETCSTYFRNDTMLCADNVDEKATNYPSDFCKGNKGGPLVCEEEVVGIQTYVEDCREPHLYQSLAVWMEFILCGTVEKCDTNNCYNVCTLIDKDKSVSKSKVTEKTTPETNLLQTNETSESEKNNYVMVSATEVSENIELHHPVVTGKITTSERIIETEENDVSTNNIEGYKNTQSTTQESEDATTTSHSSVPTAVNMQENNDEQQRNVNIAARKISDAPHRNEASINSPVVFNLIAATFILAS